MSHMFASASVFDGDISDWNVSGVTDMSHMFDGAEAFDGDLSGWNVSGVTDMGLMFRDAYGFGSDLSGWDVSNVTSMRLMFSSAFSFNSDISGWNVSKVADMETMFYSATIFNQNLGEWYVVLNSTEIGAGDAPGVVGAISAQNRFLDDQNPTYDIADGRDSFEIVNDTFLNMTVTPDKSLYAVTINSTGGFGTGNHRAYNVTVTDLDTTDPIITLAGANPLNVTAGIAYSDPGAACDDVVDPNPTLSADASGVDTQAAGTYTVTYACTDSSGNEASAARTVHVTPVPDDAFVTTWSTASAGDAITIPVGDATGNYTVHWGDGSITTHTGDAEHEYASAGSYKISISGEFTQIRLDGDAANAAKLASIDRWGEIRWTTMEGAFRYASSMVYEGHRRAGPLWRD